jgi:hypothetical protein
VKRVNRPNVVILVASFALVLSACRDEKPTPNPTTSATTSSTPLASAPSAQPTTKAPTKMVTPPDDQASADTWLIVHKDGIEVGLIELRSGKPPKLLAENESEAATTLRTRLEKVGGPNGLGLDMHLPPPSGKGRGPYGTRVIKYDDPLYRHALTEELEPDYSVKEVPRLHDKQPPAKFARLVVSRESQKVGTLDFASKPPKLTLGSPETSEVMGLRNDWDSIQEKSELRVRYHMDKDGKETLVDAKAKPGDPTYAQTVALYLIIVEETRARYGFRLEFED